MAAGVCACACASATKSRTAPRHAFHARRFLSKINRNQVSSLFLNLQGRANSVRNAFKSWKVVFAAGLSCQQNYEGTLGGGKNPDGLIQAEIDIDGYLRGRWVCLPEAGRILPLFYRSAAACREGRSLLAPSHTATFPFSSILAGNRDDTLDVRLLRGRECRAALRNQFRIAHTVLAAETGASAAGESGWRPAGRLDVRPAEVSKPAGVVSSDGFCGSGSVKGVVPLPGLARFSSGALGELILNSESAGLREGQRSGV